MKTKFYNIPKEQRTDLRKRAREYLLTCKVNHQAQPDKFFIGTLGRFCIYTFDSAQIVFALVDGQLTEIDFVYEETKGQQVAIDITKEHWPRKLFFELMKSKGSIGTQLIGNGSKINMPLDENGRPIKM